MAHEIRPLVVLLVEDDPADARLTMEAFADAGPQARIEWVRDGKAALAYLRRVSVTGGTARPDMILLDLNLPGIRGSEVLTAVKSDPHLASIPVTVLSTSTSPHDVADSYRRMANAYVSKPVRLDDYVRTVSSIGHFWTQLAATPGGVT